MATPEEQQRSPLGILENVDITGENRTMIMGREEQYPASTSDPDLFGRSEETKRAEQDGALDAADPSFDGAIAEQGKGSFQMTSNATNTGLFPERWKGRSMTPAQIEAELTKLRYDERLALKKKLYEAGYYGWESVNDGEVPTQGNMDQPLLDAMGLLMTETATAQAKAPGVSAEDVLTQTLAKNRTTFKDLSANAYGIPEIASAIQGWGQKELGRTLSDAEIEGVLQIFSKGRPTSAASPDEVSFLNDEAGLAQNESYKDLMGNPIAPPEALYGGGPGSTAEQFTKSLAGRYALKVSQGFTAEQEHAPSQEEAFTQGRAATITGDESRMAALYEWAKGQEGDGATFERVEWRYDNPGSQEPTSVMLVVNDGAERPDIGTYDFAAGKDDQGDFLNAIKRPGEGDAMYNWQGEGAHRRGAYGVSDNIWNYYTSQLGIATDDTSKQAQDRVAQAYASDLYGRYHNWEDVAMAFRKDEGEANKRNDYRKGRLNADDNFDHSEDEWVRDAVRNLGSSGVGRGAGGYGTAGNEIPYIDYTSGVDSDDPRWREQRAYRAFNDRFAAERTGRNTALLASDVLGSKQVKSQISAESY